MAKKPLETGAPEASAAKKTAARKTTTKKTASTTKKAAAAEKKAAADAASVEVPKTKIKTVKSAPKTAVKTKTAKTAKKAADENKDQSYVLYMLTQEQLAYTIFPLGDMTKPEVRTIAEKQGLVTAHKHDSQDICFVTDGNYADFIEAYTGRKCPEGVFVDCDGNVIGKHNGVIRYTIGQRKKLGIFAPEPLYVCAVDPICNTVTLGKKSELYSNALIAVGINLISCSSIEKPMRLKAKIRYRQPEQWATVTQTDKNTLRIEFDEPQRAVAKGQAVVLYDEDIVVGGGTIFSVES